MNLYIWRHNKTYHSHSMINEPCVVNEFYLAERRMAGRGPAGTGTHCGTFDGSESNLHPHPGLHRSFVRCVAVLQCDPVP